MGGEEDFPRAKDTRYATHPPVSVTDGGRKCTSFQYDDYVDDDDDDDDEDGTALYSLETRLSHLSPSIPL